MSSWSYKYSWGELSPLAWRTKKEVHDHLLGLWFLPERLNTPTKRKNCLRNMKRTSHIDVIRVSIKEIL